MFDKKIIILCIVLMICLVAFLYVDSKEAGELQKVHNEIEVRTSEYRLQRKKLQTELLALKENYIERVEGKSRLMLVFTGVPENFMEDVYPFFDDSDLMATIVFDRSLFLSDEGHNLSLDDFKYLISNGWQSALYWDGQIEIKEWYNSVSQDLLEAKVSIPKVILIDEQYNTRINNDYFTELGFVDVVVRRVEFDFEEKLEEALHTVNAVGWFSTTAARTLTTLGKESHEAVFLIGADTPEEVFDLAQFSAMMTKISESVKDNKTDVVTFEGAEVLRAEIERKYEAELQKFENEVKAIEDEIEYYNMLIDQIYDEYSSEEIE